MYGDIWNIVATETSGGLVHRIQLARNITNGRFSWVPGAYIRKEAGGLSLYHEHTPVDDGSVFNQTRDKLVVVTDACVVTAAKREGNAAVHLANASAKDANAVVTAVIVA
ncbi:hypothetical protein CLF_109403 [Clonorchis sinensis]|uniref:Uncharacterized protein n=1 Tax=Clonorchis sinensis TaxID=79923 RepID=G7YSK3_CLOSI|nr:hypothetical protein CLF_109403 [Clonorchis sinensis]